MRVWWYPSNGSVSLHRRCVADFNASSQCVFLQEQHALASFRIGLAFTAPGLFQLHATKKRHRRTTRSNSMALNTLCCELIHSNTAPDTAGPGRNAIATPPEPAPGSESG